VLPEVFLKTCGALAGMFTLDPARTVVVSPRKVNASSPAPSVQAIKVAAAKGVRPLPEVEKDRYYSIQFTDAYTFNIDYVGSRATGNDAANFLIVGPGWKGETPKGIKKMVHSETGILMPIYRVQLFNPSDLDNVKKVQSGQSAPLRKVHH
jgi:hypothetical protein